MTSLEITGEPASTSKPEIMFVITSLDIGGAERHLTTIASALARRGWRVSVYCLSEGGPMEEELRQSGAEVLLPWLKRGQSMLPFAERRIRLISSMAQLFGLLIRRRPTIVHFFLPAAYLAGAPLALLAQIPIRVMSRRSLNRYQIKYPLLGKAEKLLHRTMTAILGNSRSVVRELKDIEGVEAGQLGLIYSGLEIGQYAKTSSRPEMRTKLGLSPQTVAMVCVANLFPYKGHRGLFEALGQMDRRYANNWHLLLVGRDAGSMTELRAQASALKIDQKISFLGNRTDVKEILLASDIGLLCSDEEGFANAILESMAARLPMIVTDVGGNAEAVIDGETGIVVPPGESLRLAEAIQTLLTSAELREQYGEAGWHRISDQFSLEKCIDHYELLYRTLLAGGEPRDVPELRVTD
jgi:glycosyltransferase involved in cell wall biosynthesis